MKKPTNPTPSKVIIIPQTPQNNNMEEMAPQDKSSVETQAPVSAPTPTPAPASQQARVEPVEEKDK